MAFVLRLVAIIIALTTLCSGFKLTKDAQELLTERKQFFVSGHMYPVTIWIESEILREKLGKDFHQWICNPEDLKACIANDHAFVWNPDSPDLAMSEQPANQRRKKRFLGALLAGIIGLGGIADAESVRYEMRGEVKKIVAQLGNLETGVHTLGDELVHHIKVSQEWRKELGEYMNSQFSGQMKLNLEVSNRLKNLYENGETLKSNLDKMAQRVRRDIIGLSKVTSMGLTRLADEISIINQIINAMLWSSLKGEKFPEWAARLPMIQAGLKNLSLAIPGYDTEEGYLEFEQLVVNAQWHTIISTDQGTLIGTILPAREQVGSIETIKLPAVCVPASDGNYYTQVFSEEMIRVTLNGKTYYKGGSYYDSCDHGKGLTLCPHPTITPTPREVASCSRSLFQGEELQSCPVMLTECPQKYLIHSVGGTMVISGELTVTQGKTTVSSQGSVVFVVPLVSSDQWEFKNTDGNIVLVVHPTISKIAVKPQIVPLSGSWKIGDYTLDDVEHSWEVLTIPDISDMPALSEGVALKRIGDELVRMDKETDAFNAAITAGNGVNIVLIMGAVIIVLCLILVIIIYCMCRKRAATNPGGMALGVRNSYGS